MKKQVRIILGAVIAVAVLITAVSVVKLAKSGRFSVEETTHEPTVVEFQLLHSGEIELTLGKTMYSWVKTTEEDPQYKENDFVFFSTDENVAKIEFDHVEYGEYVYFKITPVSAGTAEIYVETADGCSQSEKTTIVVTEAEENITVFTSKTGDKYHLTAGCSADEVYELSLADALKENKTPCQKCAQGK